MQDPTAPDGAPTRYPISTQQMLGCVDPDASGPRFIQAFALRVKGALDVDALEGALNDLVERHEILRTRIGCPDEETGQQPYQIVLPQMPVPFDVRKVEETSGRSREEIATDLLVALNAEELDPAENPLLRVVLHRFDDSDAVVTVLTHHSGGDAWSSNLLRRDLAAFYRARTTGTPHGLPELHQYREFAVWQQEFLGSERVRATRDFWRRKLDGAKVFTLPSDRPNGDDVPNRTFRTVNFELSPEDFAAVESRAASVRGSGWHVLLAAGALLAEQIRGGTDVTLMTDVAGRSVRAYQNTVGFFSDFVPMRMDLSGCQTLADVLAESRGTCLEAYSNLIPISVIEEGLDEFVAPYDEPANMPFIFHYTRPVVGAAEIQFADSVELIELAEEEPSDRGRWCIWSMWRKPDGGLRGVIEYCPEVVDAATLEHWVAEFVRLLLLIATEPNLNRKAV